MSKQKAIDRVALFNHYAYVDGELVCKKPYKGSNKKPGEVMGHSVHPSGYAIVKVLGSRYRRARIIYSLVVGRIPSGMMVDHINGDRLDDRPDNYRLVTALENRWNSGGGETNGLPKGISFFKPTGKYRAQLRLKGKCFTKTSDSIEELEVWIDALRTEKHKEYAVNRRSPKRDRTHRNHK